MVLTRRCQTKEITQASVCSTVTNLSQITSKLANPGIMQTFSHLRRKVKVSEVWSHRLGFSWVCQYRASPPLSTCGSNTRVTYLYQANLAAISFSKGNRNEENLFEHIAALAECYFICYTSTSSNCLCFKIYVPLPTVRWEESSSLTSVLDMEAVGPWGALAKGKQTL